jgi:hypothetical protein
VIDLQQDERHSLVEIEINKPKILLKDRPYFKEALIFDINELKMVNSVEFIKGRWFNFPEKMAKEQKFSIFIDEVMLLYNTQEVSNTFKMEIGIKSLVNSPIINEIPHKELNKALNVNLDIG